MDIPKSPLAPKGFPPMAPVAGVTLATANTGLRYKGRPDLLLVELAEGTSAAGVFTTSKTASGAVLWDRWALKSGKGKGRGLIVNAGNANAFTGSQGEEAVLKTVVKGAQVLDCPQEQIFVSSTGTIGQALDESKITGILADMRAKAKPTGWKDAAVAITTTDTYPKGATRSAEIDGVTVRINGFAKGSGMIAPDMATLLSYIFTDAAIAPKALQQLLAEGVDGSFNSITVDSDTSTSDTLMLFATGKAGHKTVKKGSSKRLADFKAKWNEVLLDLAHQVVRDGEGATKFVTVKVTGAETHKAAKRIALSIANSPLVKTAIAGEDANWGRIVMAVGKSGEAADRDRLSVSIGGIVIAEKGQPAMGYDEAPVAQHMKGQEIFFETDVGVGKGQAVVWTCDLTHGYIDINADYRT